MARSTLAPLIQRVRTLTMAGTAEYTLGTASYWDDDQIADLLDRNRRDFEVLLDHVAPAATDETYRWRQYSTRHRDLETTDGGTAVFVVHDGRGSVLPASAYDVSYERGIVEFHDSQAGSARYLRARSYDVYAAAADLLDAWSAREKLAFDFSGDDQSFRRSQKFKMLGDLATKYRAQQWTVTTPVVRSDVSTEGWNR